MYYFELNHLPLKINKLLYSSNPNGRTGFRGRGSLGRWGPNHTVAVIVSR